MQCFYLTFLFHSMFLLLLWSNITVLSEGVPKYGENAVYAPTPSPTYSPSPCPPYTMPEHEPFPTSLPYLGPILRQCQFGKTCFCTYSRPRYQVSIYRTIGPLVCFCFNNNGQIKNPLTLCNVLISHFCFIRCLNFCCGSKHYSIK